MRYVTQGLGGNKQLSNLQIVEGSTQEPKINCEEKLRI